MANQDVQRQDKKHLAADPEWRELEKRADSAREASLRAAGDVFLTLAFLSGNQHCEFSLTKGLQEVENEADELRVTENRMLPAFLRWMGYLFKEKPVITCFAGGRELRDAERAKVAGSLCDYWESNNGWRQARREAAQWMGVSGVGYVGVSWRKNTKKLKRKKLEYVPEGFEEDNKVKFLREKMVEDYAADVAFDCWPSLQVFPFPLGVRTWDKVEGLLTIDVVTRGTLLRQYGAAALKDKDLIALETADLNAAMIEKLNLYCQGTFALSDAAAASEEPLYLVLQWLERPSEQYANGRQVVAAGGRLLRDEDLPYVREAREIDPGDRYNLSMGVIPVFAGEVPGRLIPPAPFAELRQAQVRLNDLLTDEQANRKTVGRNKLLVEQGGLKADQWTGQHGEVVELKAGAVMAPQYIQGKPLVGIGEEIARVLMAFDEISGQTAVLRGQNPAQVRSAFHLDILREEAMSNLEEVFAKHEESYELQAKLALAIARNRYSTERIITIYGKDYAADARHWRLLDINPDIRLKQGSMRPRNQAVREEKLKELFTMGAFIDPRTGKPNTAKFWKMTTLGTTEENVDPETWPELRAADENEQMLSGVVIEPMEHEDHQTHVDMHKHYMERQEWYASPDTVRAVFIAHLETHNKLLASQLAPEIDAAADPVAGLGDGAIPSTSPESLQLPAGVEAMPMAGPGQAAGGPMPSPSGKKVAPGLDKGPGPA